MSRELPLNKLQLSLLNKRHTIGVFGKGASMWINGQEVAIMARDTKGLQMMFDKLKEKAESTLDLTKVYDVVLVQSQDVTLLDEQL